MGHPGRFRGLSHNISTFKNASVCSLPFFGVSRLVFALCYKLLTCVHTSLISVCAAVLFCYDIPSRGRVRWIRAADRVVWGAYRYRRFIVDLSPLSLAPRSLEYCRYIDRRYIDNM